MRFPFKIVIVVCVLFILSISVLCAGELNKQTFTVIIDPGHGGKDPGAVYKNIREKDVVLSIALKLGNYIKENLKDVSVVYTRQSDKFVPLHERANIANKSNADLFISLHANYCGTPSISGTETFVLGLHRTNENLEVAKKENAVILMEEDYSSRYEGFDPNLPESYIMFEMVQDDYIEQSINLAADIQDQFRARAGRNDRSVKQAGFLVLRQTSMPSVLVETGFLSNPTEANYLNSNDGQSILASAIYRAVKEYKSRIDARSDIKMTNPIAAMPEKATTNKAIDGHSDKDSNIQFSVQIAVSSKKINPVPDNFRGLSPVFCYPTGNLYKYVIGKECSIEKIQNLKLEAQKKYPDAFIVAFENGTQIPLKKALKKLNQ